jgi:hypothetical protein
MKARLVKFGEIEVEGKRYTHDVVIDGGKVRKRKKSFCVVGAQADGLRLFEIALVFVRVNHIASFIVNANHGVM